MSAFFLSEDADEDLQTIYRYGEQTWGETQARTYLAGLFALFDRLADQPGIGRMRPEVGADIRSFRHGQHLVFFMEWDEETAILRVLHGRMDIEGAFEGHDPTLAVTARRSP